MLNLCLYAAFLCNINYIFSGYSNIPIPNFRIRFSKQFQPYERCFREISEAVYDHHATVSRVRSLAWLLLSYSRTIRGIECFRKCNGTSFMIRAAWRLECEFFEFKAFFSNFNFATEARPYINVALCWLYLSEINCLEFSIRNSWFGSFNIYSGDIHIHDVLYLISELFRPAPKNWRPA